MLFMHAATMVRTMVPLDLKLDSSEYDSVTGRRRALSTFSSDKMLVAL